MFKRSLGVIPTHLRTGRVKRDMTRVGIILTPDYFYQRVQDNIILIKVAY